MRFARAPLRGGAIGTEAAQLPSGPRSTLGSVAKAAAVQHACTECGTTSGRWLGRCPGCGEFGTIVRGALPQRRRLPASRGLRRPPLRLVDVVAEEAERIPTGVAELDRVLGGGLVPASLVLVGGEPGVGKSTLLLSALGAISARPAGAARHRRGVGRAGEAARRAARRLRRRRDPRRDRARRRLRDARARAPRRLRDRLGADALRRRSSARRPGSVAQVREAAARLLRVAKEAGVATFLVGHVTKDGSVAGPRVLEHLVDCVLQFEGDRYHAHRILRAVKNRFGSTNELGVFEMTGTGLVGVPDPSAIFGAAQPGEVGAAVACTLEGTRPLLLEIQALVAPTDLAMPRRVGTGVDPKRLAMIVAVLARHAGPAARRRRRLRQRRRRRADRRAGRRPRDRARDRLGGARACRCATAWPRSARSGSPGACGRRRRPTGGVEECRKLGLATVLAPAGTNGAPSRPRRCAGARRRRSAAAEKPRLSRDFRENPCKNGAFARVSGTLAALAGGAFEAAGAFATTDGRGSQLVQGRRQGGVSAPRGRHGREA